ncbi:ferric reductase NAD binding domain-containing protein [Talaromyces proteolyticus]|uniref:Ferric reductase NAD binding domain-containing protein n=1 Tax=Talaromyces proteolyticus TaxID=1131652 RepID=A0AAD4L0I0_9EURO|nr:ferric reductase NAD binding domain-containing protein [Talaromyces proteolyticus]KAH8703994.1 ferric reductase NAD binding domain-containing protein [Talaromyces proteolyticus]
MGMGSDSTSSDPLTSSGVDFSNETQALDFLQDILDDSVLGVTGNQYARYFWYGVAVAIGIATICNMIQTAVLKMRIRACSSKRACPAKPANFLTKSLAAAIAVLRESSYLQFTPLRASWWIKLPIFGSIYIIIAYFAFILVLVFTNNNIPGAQHYQALGIRAGWLAAAQVPLLVLLSSKMNLISFLCNVSYERLNVYHRWVARGLLLLATFHFAFQSHAWNIYGLMVLEWDTDACPPTGMAAYAILLWMNLTTLAPFRAMAYELFVIQHLLTYFGFIIAIAYHLYGTSSPYSTNYIYISVGLYLFAHLVRFLRNAFNNFFQTGRASLMALEGGATKIRISNRRIKKWKAGSYVRLFIPHFGIVQSHPATILSSSGSHDGDLVFVLRSYGGFTKRILEAAAAGNDDSQASPETQQLPSYLAFIDGPYHSSQSDLVCFDTLVLIAGASGVTFTLSNLLDIAGRASRQKLPLQTVYFTWIIKKKTWLSWIAEELTMSFKKLQEAGIETHISIYITCDDLVAGESSSRSAEKLKSGCQCEDECQCCNTRSTSIDIQINRGHTDEKAATSNRICSNQDVILPCANLFSGRPSFDTLMRKVICEAQGEAAVAVCGPLGLSVSVRSAVVQACDDLAVNKGSGLQGVYLHVENFN